jgi:hypothetical protein
MTALSIQPTFPTFTDSDGTALENGFIWIGVAGSDPISTPLTAYWDAALTQVVTQPVRTRGGYPLNGSAIGRLYVNSNYSIKVRNRNGFDLYSSLTATERYNEVVVNTNASQVVYDPAGTGAVATTVQAKLRESVSVKDFGASSTATGSANLIAFKAAVAAVPVGATLVIPSDASFYLIDTSGGLSAAVEINKRMTVVFEGDVKASFGAIQANPPTIFYVTADDVSFVGGGKLIGDGTVNSVNTGTDATMPSLARVTGDAFTFDGPIIDTPHKIGIHLDSCFYAKVTNSNFTGGPVAYSDTAYFAVRATGGGKHIISNNQFYPSGTGGMFVQCVFFNATSDCLIEGNIATRPYEKLAYLTGSRNIVTGNSVLGNSGTIPGTNQQGTVGPALRCDGADNKITNNFTNYGGGASCRLGGGNDVSGNTFLNAGQSGVSIFDGTGVFDYTTIRNNTMVCGNLSGILVTHGIQITPSTGSNKYIDVSGNTITGFGIADPIANIPAWQASTTYPTVSIVKPTVGNSRYYTTNGGGVSGSTEPTWPTTPGVTVVDGTITWTCQAYDTGNASINLGGSYIYDVCTILQNNVAGAVNGVKTANLNNSKVSYNIIAAGTTGVVEASGASNVYELNNVSAPTDFSGLATSSQLVGYATGDWTPVLSDGTNDATMGGAGSNNGKWTRIGRQVTVTGNIATTSLGLVAGAIRIRGLPFVVGTGAGGRSALLVGYGGGFSITAGTHVTGYVDGGTQYVDLQIWGSATGTTSMTAAQWTNSGNMGFSLTYFV